MDILISLGIRILVGTLSEGLDVRSAGNLDGKYLWVRPLNLQSTPFLKELEFLSSLFLFFQFFLKTKRSVMKKWAKLLLNLR